MNWDLLDILIVIYAPLERYPPTLHQALIMEEAKLKVGVIDTFQEEVSDILQKEKRTIMRIHACRHAQNYDGHSLSLPHRIYNLIRFRSVVNKIISRYQPKVIIACDPYAIFLTGKRWEGKNSPYILWHFHELPFITFPEVPSICRGMVKVVESFQVRWAKKADALLFPDSGRANYFCVKAGVTSTPYIVQNCPRRLHDLPRNRLDSVLHSLGYSPEYIVYFQGFMGKSRCLEYLIRSIAYWPKNCHCVLIGPIRKEYKETLLGEAALIQRQNSITFLDPVSYDELFSFTIGADIGVVLVDGDTNPNWQYSSGAINKRFEYMAVGVPQVTNTGPGMQELMEKSHGGLLVTPKSPMAIGEAINRLLEDFTLRSKMAISAREAHLHSFHYEKQFSPVLHQILSWIKEQR